MTLIDTEPTPDQTRRPSPLADHRHRRRCRSWRIGVGALVTRHRETIRLSRAMSPPTQPNHRRSTHHRRSTRPEAQPPEEFTVVHRPGPVVHDRHGRCLVVVPSPDGDDDDSSRVRGSTYRQSLDLGVRSAPRRHLVPRPGTQTSTPSPETNQDPDIVAFTDRIENDEGAWQGSVVMLEPISPAALEHGYPGWHGLRRADGDGRGGRLRGPDRDRRFRRLGRGRLHRQRLHHRRQRSGASRAPSIRTQWRASRRPRHAVPGQRPASNALSRERDRDPMRRTERSERGCPISPNTRVSFGHPRPVRRGP